MSEKLEKSRTVWSCSLLPFPGEDEAARLEEALIARELSVWEDAKALERWLRLRGLSQAEGAKRLTRSPAAVANRLRLLKLPEDIRSELHRRGFTERHGRALLRLRSPQEQRRAAQVILRKALNVAQTEELVEALLSPQGAAARMSRERRKALDALMLELSELQKSVPDLRLELREKDGGVELRLFLPGG